MHFNKLKISTVHLSKNFRAVGSGVKKFGALPLIQQKSVMNNKQIAFEH
jgi:hypothetical protein